MTTPADRDGDYLPPVIPPPPLHDDRAGALVAAINGRLLAGAAWRCAGCIPQISVTLGDVEWTEHVRHTHGCSAFADRLLGTTTEGDRP